MRLGRLVQAVSYLRPALPAAVRLASGVSPVVFSRFLRPFSGASKKRDTSAARPNASLDVHSFFSDRARLQKLGPKGISMFLVKAAKQTKVNRELDVFGSGNIQRLVEAVKHTFHYQWPSRDVAGVLYSLSCLRKQMSNKAEAESVAELLSYMTGVISSSTTPFGAVDLSQSLFGLRKLSDTSSEVRALLSALASKVRECREPLSDRVCNALNGLQSCSSDSAEVREVLSALAAKVRECREPLDAQAVTNALYGLKGCSSDSAEVREVLSALAAKVRECRESLSAKAVGTTLYGLKGCSSDKAEVREVLSALAAKVRECREPLNAQAVGTALYGLKG
jgi:hypothetical protein